MFNVGDTVKIKTKNEILKMGEGEGTPLDGVLIDIRGVIKDFNSLFVTPDMVFSGGSLARVEEKDSDGLISLRSCGPLNVSTFKWTESLLSPDIDVGSRVQIIGHSDYFGSGRVYATVSEKTSSDGQDRFKLTDWCGTQRKIESYWRFSGRDLLPVQDLTVLLKAPIEEAVRWNEGIQKKVIDSLNRIGVRLFLEGDISRRTVRNQMNSLQIYVGRNINTDIEVDVRGRDWEELYAGIFQEAERVMGRETIEKRLKKD